MGEGRRGAKSHPGRNHAVEREAARRVWLGGVPRWCQSSSGRARLPWQGLLPSHLWEKEMYFLE